MATNYTPGGPGDATPTSTGGTSSGSGSGKKKKSSTPSAQQGTPRWWAIQLLTRLGAPTTSANITAIVAWEAAEGGHWNNSASYNPLNTTENEPGATAMNSVGVKAYTSWDEGLNATVATLQNGYYGSILNALRGGSNAQAVANAVVNSKWGTQSISIGSATAYANTQDSGGGAGVGPNASNADVTKYIQQNYGDVAAFLDIPQIKDILFKAARQGWDYDTLRGAVEATDWWKTHSDTARGWIDKQKTDPATWNQAVGNEKADILIQAQQLGINLTDADAATIASHALMFGWDPAMIQSAIGAHYQYVKGGANQGQAGTTVDTLRSLANDYLVPMSDQRLNNWTQQVLSGKTTAEGFKDTLIRQAASLFPQFKKDLEGGQTMQQIVDPYRQLAAQTLEVDPSTIDFMQPKWRTAIDQVNPDNNQRHALSLSDWQTKMMSDPTYGWRYTHNALQSLAQAGVGIAKSFGYE